ncbi:alkylmercury lyase family protein [Amycolatopsis anabasis]|uniref:alkylmercury lyase family protein n=1 Tax=Amycolatopsis anabasis TaxID=1840409 RepID=UPI00131C10B0|nr:alkylmercury lyase family protein [Amycolatopsis anabasis]
MNTSTEPGTDDQPETGIDDLLGSVTSKRITTLPHSVRAVHRTILRTFADTGTAPTRRQLATQVGNRDAGLEATLDALTAADLIGIDEVGEIAYAYPFSTRPTAHRVRLPGGTQPYAMCAIDALGIPTMLGTDAVITSRDAETGEPITVDVTDHGTTTRWQPADAVVYLGSRTDCCATTSAGTCCGYINFFTSHRNALAWAENRPDLTGRVLDQDRALAAGVRCFGDLLRTRTEPTPHRKHKINRLSGHLSP